MNENIFGYSTSFSKKFSKNDREIESVVLHTINHLNRMSDDFFLDFSFLLIYFSKKINETD